MKLEDKKGIVVGGASGFGLATVKLLKENGVEVAILDLSSSKGTELSGELGVPFFECDIMDYAGAENAVRDAAAQLGGLNICVTTAGGGIAKRTLTKDGPHPIEEFAHVCNLNLVASFNISRIAADIMSQETPDEFEQRGVIINTASIAAFEGQIGQVAYTASKAGVANMSLVIARDLGNMGIRCLAIAPSLFRTGITAAIPEDMEKALTKDCAFPKRMGRPEEYALLAKAIVENPMLNGQCIRLDAGVRFAPK